MYQDSGIGGAYTGSSYQVIEDDEDDEYEYDHDSYSEQYDDYHQHQESMLPPTPMRDHRDVHNKCCCNNAVWCVRVSSKRVAFPEFFSLYFDKLPVFLWESFGKES